MTASTTWTSRKWFPEPRLPTCRRPRCEGPGAQRTGHRLDPDVPDVAALEVFVGPIPGDHRLACAVSHDGEEVLVVGQWPDSSGTETRRDPDVEGVHHRRDVGRQLGLVEG